MTLLQARRLLELPTTTGTTWQEFLAGRVDVDWRPDEFDPSRLRFVPVVGNSDNTLSECLREACGVHIGKGGKLCPSCRAEYVAAATDLPYTEWAAQAGPRVRLTYERHCGVEGCQRSRARAGLCSPHASSFVRWSKRTGGDVDAWVVDKSPHPLIPGQRCLTGCGRDGDDRGLCKTHGSLFRRWAPTRAGGPATPADWLRVWWEPYLDDDRATYAEHTVTDFGLMSGTAGLELLFAVQQRERTGRLLNPLFLRSVYLTRRRDETESLVGLDALGFDDIPQGRKALYRQWQRHVDDLHREWSGVDDRDRRVIYLRDVNLRKTRGVGPEAKFDLRSVNQTWIVEAFRRWLDEARRGYDDATKVRAVWVVAAEVLARRGTPLRALGAQDMDAIVRATNQRWFTRSDQRRAIKAVKDLLTFARNREEFGDTWGRIPARFAVDAARHQPTAVERSQEDADDAYRFVPQPIIEHLMNRLNLIRHTNQYTGEHDAYRTAEARAMIYVQERLGRRTVETVKLLDNCITFDDQGAAYVEWVRGKPPYTKGKRLPIHQETHDVIRQWQTIKADHGVTSKWLFPKRDSNSRMDQHWDTGYLRRRLSKFIKAVIEHAPLEEPVEGLEGNLIHFDLRTIDPYSFRHAFAQRFADATDADGRPTTPPDVLQELMGHAHYDTTMGYYQVSARRRKQAVEALPARRLNLHGHVVPVDRERDGFTKVAVTLGHCTEPQNVAALGHGCMVNHACESCPFFLVDPLEREGMAAKRHALKVQLERARAIQAQPHMLDHYQARIDDCTRIIDGIDNYIGRLSEEERFAITRALDSMADVRKAATTPRLIDLRAMFEEESHQ